MKKILNIFIFLIFGIIIVFNLISIVSIKILQKNYANFFGYTYFEVQTGSMIPTINVDDVIIVKLDDEYEVGDIVTYNDNGSFVTHRIIEINDDKYITKGDANNTSDKEITKDQIIGHVVKIIDNLGIITKTLQEPITLIIIFVVGGLIIAFVSFGPKKEEE